MKKVMKRLVALLMGMAVLFTAIPCSEALATEGNTARITVTNTTVTAGDYAYFYVNASSFTDLVGLEYSLYYDANVMTLNWVYADGNFVSSASKDINKNTAGEIKCSIMNVDGLNGNGRLLRLGFRIKEDAKHGDYPVTLVIGDAYDSGFNPISIAKTSGTLTVNEKLVTATSISFSTLCDKTTVKQGDTFTYTLKAGYTYGLACGNFEFQYDRDLLEITEVGLGKELLTNTAIYSVNQETPGYIKISYADIEAISSMYGVEYFKLTFSVKENVDASTNIEFAANSLVDANLQNMQASNLTRQITIEKEEEEVSYPVMKLQVGEIAMDGSFTIDVILETGTNVAAGDFVITYNRSQVVCQSIERDSAVTERGGYLISKETIDQGSISFSYMITDPFSVEQRIAVLEFQANEEFYGNTTFGISGKDVVDIDYIDVTLTYQGVTTEIPVWIRTLTAIPINTNYYIGDRVNENDFSLEALYNDGHTETITSGYHISSVDMTTAGTKTVTVSYEGFEAIYDVVVISPSIEISKESTTIIAERTGILTATILPTGGTIEWISSDEAVATVVDGVVKGLGIGRTTITAKFTYKGIVYTDTCEVEVIVLPIILGDVNADGEVNNLDRQILTRHLAKWAGYEAEKLNMEAADVNQDGEVNNLDRQILTRHLAKWAGYEELPYLTGF